MQEKPKIPEAESPHYPASRDELTVEIFQLLTDINTAIDQRTDESAEINVEDKQAARSIARDTIAMYYDPTVRGLNINDWQSGIDILRQMKDEARRVVKIEEVRINEMYIKRVEERRELFSSRLAGLRERIERIDAGKIFKTNLKELEKQFERAAKEGNMAAESHAWLGLKNLEALSDKEIGVLSDMLGKY
jgi:hypothetical protein